MDTGQGSLVSSSGGTVYRNQNWLPGLWNEWNPVFPNLVTGIENFSQTYMNKNLQLEWLSQNIIK